MLYPCLHTLLTWHKRDTVSSRARYTNVQYMCSVLCLAEITKANEEVNRVMNLYDEIINKTDIASLLTDDDHRKLTLTCNFELKAL